MLRKVRFGLQCFLHRLIETLTISFTRLNESLKSRCGDFKRRELQHCHHIITSRIVWIIEKAENVDSLRKLQVETKSKNKRCWFPRFHDREVLLASEACKIAQLLSVS